MALTLLGRCLVGRRGHDGSRQSRHHRRVLRPLRICQMLHSDWTGDRRAARMAGSSPAAAPMMTAAARPPAQAAGGMTTASVCPPAEAVGGVAPTLYPLTAPARG